MKRCRAIAFATALSVSAPAAHAQNEPRFQSSVEVTPIEVTIVDGRDRTISDLKSAEFIVQVDGMPRRVVSAEWIPLTSKASAAALARIESELEGYYLLGVESIDSDRDHMSHSLTVDTSRRGVSVRAGRYLP